ncbi:MAG TPA: Rieske 2Fe-2S domain-containing protein [Rariglobus sp.]|jgi:nitrite reductase/ring-hydroxylating ferredoxin subunit/DMSO/TMAO reductase YedYZ heme-binding membrane subunit|nr:Rieske 2Fe-2S domain-containing protein [Rariglobus sp.]
MSVGYQAVGWNRQKKLYDVTLAGGVAAYVAVFCGVGALLHGGATPEMLIIRACGSAAFILLHVILCIGPLARLDARFLPLLYNRRHLGVTMCLLAVAHAAVGMIQFHTLGVVDPLANVLAGEGDWARVSLFPFQVFGFFALVILVLMAATSHDFWLANLTAPVWKALHMLVYAAYALLVAHVAFGAGQAPQGRVILALTTAGAVAVVGLHVFAALKGAVIDRAGAVSAADGWVDAGPVDAIPENRAKVLVVSGERVAIFRYAGKISAVSSVCQHQNGPLGEGRVIDGCITCPWHGYQYLPDTGSSPPPFTEKIPTFWVAVREGRVRLHPRPLPAGTPVEPALIEA